jgi:16S rRNA processing protein RimM
VHALHDFGGGEMLEIAGPQGRLGTISFTRAAVPDIDLAARRVTVDWAAVLWPGREPEESCESGPDGGNDG